jgi:hypothetical protein
VVPALAFSWLEPPAGPLPALGYAQTENRDRLEEKKTKERRPGMKVMFFGMD